jgi:hypothetical protein
MQEPAIYKILIERELFVVSYNNRDVHKYIKTCSIIPNYTMGKIDSTIDSQLRCTGSNVFINDMVEAARDFYLPGLVFCRVGILALVVSFQSSFQIL